MRTFRILARVVANMSIGRRARMCTIFALALASIWYYPFSKELAIRYGGQELIFADFHIYYEAAKGNFEFKMSRWDPVMGANGWVYADWTATLWRPFTYLPYEAARLLWYVLLTIASLWITARLLKVKYGWIAFPIALKAFGWTLASGNVYPILIALCFHPLGVLVASLVKPQLLCLGGIYAFGEGYRILAQRRALREEHRNLSLASDHLLRSSQMA